MRTPSSLSFALFGWLTTESIITRKAHLSAIPEYSSFDQIDFADSVQITRRADEFACTASKVQGIGNYGEQSLRERNRRGCRWIKRERVSRLRNPVMLDMEYQGVPRAGLGRAQDSSTHGAPQISRRGSHSGVLVDGAEVGHDGSAHDNAVTRGGLRARGSLWC